MITNTANYFSVIYPKAAPDAQFGACATPWGGFRNIGEEIRPKAI
jgi:hypothetical protein